MIDTGPLSPEFYQRLRIMAHIALAGALIGALGDWLMLYNPEGGYLAGDYQFMAALAPWRIQLGQYLGVLFIPLQLFGILPLWHLFRHQKPQLANGLLAGAIFFTIIGATYHGMLGMLGGYVTLHDTGATGVLAHRTEAFAMLKSMLEPYGAVLMLMYLALSVVLARECWQGIAHLPRWLAFLSPFGQYMLLLLLWLIVPPLGNFLVPAGINLTMAVFFGALSRQLYPPSPQAA